MSELNVENVDQVLKACREGALMAGLAFSEAFGFEITLSVDRSDSVDRDAFPDDLKGAGIFVVLEARSAAAILVLPATTPFLPHWCHDAREVPIRLETLAKQARVLLPTASRTINCWSMSVFDIHDSLDRAGLHPGAPRIQLQLTAGSQRAPASLIWPFRHVEQLLIPDDIDADSASSHPITWATVEEGLAQLPPYARSLLKVHVPVSVTLATTRQALRRILELSPGAIISFKKPCDETLTLEVGGQPIADGEAVKVGDKFGLWITRMTFPKERFRKVIGAAAQLSHGAGI
ncbi:MAG: hypothetical protein FJ297_14970 [Planctomycetes bacterium]|nr:hypothetical protein [Planctomycetota bacterium]